MKELNQEVILYDALEDIEEGCLYPADTFPDLNENPKKFELIIQRLGYIAKMALTRYHEKSGPTKKSA